MKYKVFIKNLDRFHYLYYINYFGYAQVKI